MSLRCSTFSNAFHLTQRISTVLAGMSRELLSVPSSHSLQTSLTLHSSHTDALLFLQHASHAPTKGPLHLSPLLGAPSLQIGSCSVPLCRSLSKCHLPSETFLATLCKISVPVPSFPYSLSLIFLLKNPRYKEKKIEHSKK